MPDLTIQWGIGDSFVAVIYDPLIHYQVNKCLERIGVDQKADLRSCFLNLAGLLLNFLILKRYSTPEVY